MTTMAAAPMAKEAPIPMEEEQEKSDALSEAIEKIIIAVEGRNDLRTNVFEQGDSTASDTKTTNNTSGGGPLRPQELAELSRSCTVALSSNGTKEKLDFANVDGELLASLFELMEKHVRSAANVNLVEEACQALAEPAGEDENEIGKGKKMTTEKWLKGTPNSPSAGTGMKRLFVLKNGLEAASILLSIMTAPGVDRRIVSEDCIEACIALIRQHLSKNILPAITNTGHVGAFQSDAEKAVAAPAPAKKPKKSPKKGGSKEQSLVQNLKQVYKHILASSDLFLGLVERIDGLVQSVPLEDQMLSNLASSAWSVFGIEPSSSSVQSPEAQLCHLLQVSAISLLTTIFQCLPVDQRRIFLQDLFPILLQLPTSKKSLRTFVAHSESDTAGATVKRALFPSADQQQHNIQAITVLILSLIQCCVEMPTFRQSDEERPPQLQSGLGHCQDVCNTIASQLLQRCARKGEDGGASEYRPILGNLVDDLLLLLLSPEYPAAGMLLLTIQRVLSNDVLQASSLLPKKSGSPHVEATYLTTAFDVLGKISASAAGILAAHKAKPLKISKSHKDNKPVDSSEVDCHCGKSNTQLLLVNCDDCKGWFHGECVGITRQNVPRVWVCDDCRLREMVVEETRAFAEQSLRNQPEGFSGSESDCISDTHILRQLLLNYLTEESSTSDSPAKQFARHVHLAQWIDELCAPQVDGTDAKNNEHAKASFGSQLERDHFLQQWDVSRTSSAQSDHVVGSASRRCLNKEGNVRLMLNLTATKSPLVLSFSRQLGLLLQLMADESQTSIRKVSVKAISQVIEADPLLMVHPAVQKAVSLRFADDAKSVRDAAVALVGNFVVKSPEIANAFHSSLLKCLTDEGVSVKKRAVKIFRDVLQSNPLYKGRAQAAALMLRQAANPKEDDSVRDLIHELFSTLWLEGDPNKLVVGTSPPKTNAASAGESNVSNNEAAAALSPNGSGVVTPLTPHGSSAIETNGATDATEGDRKKKRRNNVPTTSPRRQTKGFLAATQMIDVVLTADNKEVLTALLKELMGEFSDADKDRKESERKKRIEAMRSHCAFLVDSMMEQLLVLEESRTSLGYSFGKKLVALFRTLAVFGEIAPAEVLRHLDTFVPYLKADNNVSLEQESQIVSEICELLYRLAPLMTSRDILRMADGAVVDDLVSITRRFGIVALSSSMRALAGLAKTTAAEGDNVITDKLMKNVATFYGYLLKIKQSERDFSASDVKTRSNISRALGVLGAFCRNHEVDEEEWPEMDAGDIDSNELTASTVMYACYSLFVYYLQQDDADTKCAALRALSGVFMARPRVMLMLEEDGTIKEIMSPSSPVALQLESLRCWKEILIAEDRRVATGDAKARMKAKAGGNLSRQISGDLDGDATLVGGVVGQHVSRLYSMTTSQDHRIRLATVDLLGNLLQMGLLNPMQTVPHLFALQGDVKAPNVRALALRLLIIEGEKRPDMLRQRGLDGVKQAYRFQRTVYPSKLEPLAVVKQKRGKQVEAVCIFGSVFKECIQSSKKQRLGLYRNLLGLFETDEDEDEMSNSRKMTVAKKKKAAHRDLPLLSFVAQVLAHLPYNTASDPLFIIHRLSSTATLQGEKLLERLTSFLQSHDLSGCDALDSLHGEDILERAAKEKAPSRVKEVSAIRSPDFDVAQFSELCGSSCAIVLLLRLKAFLRKAYNLSETRCLEYNPDAKERICDQKHISSPANMPIFNASVVGNKGDAKLDTLIRQYAEFRKLMRIEQSLDARMTDSEGEPTPPNSRKRKNSEAS